MTTTDPQYALLVGIDGSITPTPLHPSIIASGELAGNYVRATEPNMPLHVYRHVNLSREGYAELDIAMGVASDVEARIAAEREAVRTELAEARAAARSWETNARASFQDVVHAERAHGTALRTAQAEQHRAGKIIEQARTWKRHALAADAEADTLHAAITSAEMRARVAERDRDIIERKLDKAIMGANRERVMRREAQAQALAAEERISEAQAQALATVAKIAAALPEHIVDGEILEPNIGVRLCYSPEDLPTVELDASKLGGALEVTLDGHTIYRGYSRLAKYPRMSLAGDSEPRCATETGRAEADGATISRQLDEIRELQAERAAMIVDAQNWKAVLEIPGLATYLAAGGRPAIKAVEDGIDHMTAVINSLAKERQEIAEENRALRGCVDKLDQLLDAARGDRDQVSDAYSTYQRQLEGLEHANNVERHRHEEREAELQHRIQQHVDSGVQSRRIIWGQVREALGLDNDIDALSAARDLRRRLESAQADTQRLERERDEQRAECDRAHDMRRKLDQALADEKRAAQATQAGLRTMIRQRDEIIRSTRLILASVAIDSPISESQRAVAADATQAAGELAPLGDERDLRDDQSVLDGIRATQNVIRAWKAAPQYELTEQLNIALAELAEKHNL